MKEQPLCVTPHSDSVVSYLFVPGDRPERFEKAANSDADSIILDLEDAVPPAKKLSARDNVAVWLSSGRQCVVRINSVESEWYKDDISMLSSHVNAVIMLPKAAMQPCKMLIGSGINAKFIALIETVAGLKDAISIAHLNDVGRLAFGHLDFSVDARIPPTSPMLNMARYEIAIASRSGSLPTPIDGVTTTFNDNEALERDVVNARDYGFGGKLCIHPAQLVTVNKAFRPSLSEAEWACKVLRAVDASEAGVFEMDGKMVDAPVIAQAKRIDSFRTLCRSNKNDC